MKTILTLFALAFSTTFLCAQSNTAISLDGTDDYMSMPASVSVSQLTQFTLESWVYWTGTGNGCIYAETVAGINDPGFSVVARSANSGRLALKLTDGSGTGLDVATTTGAIASNRWVHVAVVRTSATNLQVYIDGKLTDDLNFTAPSSWTPDAVSAGVRRSATNTDFFNGRLEELRLWNVARTQQEIKAKMYGKDLNNGGAALVARYRFNEGTGILAANAGTTTPSADATLLNGVTWVNSPVQFTANAIHFDQVNDRFGAPIATTATTNVTMEAWIYHNGGRGTDHMIMTNGNANFNGYALFINTQLRLIVSVGSAYYGTTYYVPTNQWCHLAMVFSTTGVTVYADGVSIYTNNVLPTTPVGSFVMGYRDGFGQPYDGGIDEVRIWNVARTQAEIQAAMYDEIDPATPGLAAYYTFNQGVTDGDNTGLTTVVDQAGGNNGTMTNFALSGTTSNFIGQQNALEILPVRWQSFTAQVVSGQVMLNWSTAQEMNNRDFRVEHSTDQNNWTAITTMAGAGNSNSTRRYQYLHETPASGRNFYRIRQTDMDGSYSFTEIRSVSISKTQTALRIMGNPVSNGVLRFSLLTEGAQQVTLYHADGRAVWSGKLGTGVHEVRTAGLAKGTYLLRCAAGSEQVFVR